ncbi:isochorismatase family protein [Pseudonocardia hierapolitana]|uniref:isochorismatase family protein n=1 Tax=Pseudonocardia hierapolitana TaxID=1128676 RepID=UPI0011BDF547
MAQALLVVDVQRGLVSGPDAVPAAPALLTVLDGLLAGAREAGALVVHLQNDGPHGRPDEPHTPGWELARVPRAGEPVLRKTGDDPFAETDLAALLEDHGVTRLAVCGVLSEFCVSAAARGALERGLGVVLPHDAHATVDVPPGPGSPGVPAALASRAAEWALGDEIEVVATAAEVRFTALASLVVRGQPAQRGGFELGLQVVREGLVVAEVAGDRRAEHRAEPGVVGLGGPRLGRAERLLEDRDVPVALPDGLVGVHDRAGGG